MNENNTTIVTSSSGYSLKSRRVIGFIFFLVSLVVSPLLMLGMGANNMYWLLRTILLVLIFAPVWIIISLLVSYFSKNQERTLSFALLPSFYPFLLILVFIVGYIFE
jgi:hypothetical protein